jgi:predicted lipoprotein
MRILLAALVIATSSAALAQSVIPANDIISGAVDGYIRPNIAAFAADTVALRKNVAALCATPSADTLSAAQEGFRATALSFSRVEFLHLGPQTIADRAERLLFWPDSKGIALRQVQQALAQQDPTAATPQTLQKKSVAMQGLGALEYVLFGTGSEALGGPGDSYRCSYADAIATLVAGIATTLDNEWRDSSANGPVAHMLDPQPDAQDYRSSREVLDKLAGTLIVGTETIRDQRVSPVLGLASGTPKPRSALFWRSGMTVPALRANFEGLRDFFAAARFGDALPASARWIARGAEFEFDKAVATAAEITDPIDVAVSDPAQFGKLRTLANITQSLDTLLGENMPGTLGLTTGFSLLDGD